MLKLSICFLGRLYGCWSTNIIRFSKLMPPLTFNNLLEFCLRRRLVYGINYGLIGSNNQVMLEVELLLPGGY